MGAWLTMLALTFGVLPERLRHRKSKHVSSGQSLCLWIRLSRLQLPSVSVERSFTANRPSDPCRLFPAPPLSCHSVQHSILYHKPLNPVQNHWKVIPHILFWCWSHALRSLRRHHSRRAINRIAYRVEHVLLSHDGKFSATKYGDLRQTALVSMIGHLRTHSVLKDDVESPP